MALLSPVYREDGWTSEAVGTKFPYLPVAIALHVIVFVWEVYVEWRQQRQLHDTRFPRRLAQLLATDKKTAVKAAEEPEHEDDATEVSTATLEQFHKSRAYGLDKSKFAISKATINVVVSVASMWLGFFPLAWMYSATLVEIVGLDASNEVFRTLAFVTIVVARDAVLTTACTLYSTFVIEERHGFNKETLRGFVINFCKEAALIIVLAYPVVALVTTVVLWAGEYFYVYAWVIMATISLGFMLLLPTTVLPLLLNLTPLPDGPLRTQIEQFAKKLNFPVAKIAVSDSSKRSGHTNAQILGKSIFIDDTTLAAITDEEVVAVLAHELGHYKRWHLTRMLSAKQAYDFLKLYTFAWCLRDTSMFANFGFAATTATTVTASPSIAVGYLLFTTSVWLPVEWVHTFAARLHARFVEFDADAFAVDHGYGVPLQRALTKLSMENLVDPRTDAFYSAYRNSHPTLVERLDAIIARGKKHQ